MAFPNNDRIKAISEKRSWYIGKPCKNCSNVKKDIKGACLKCKSNWHFINKYGISLEERNELAKSQNNLCAICFRKVELLVDHDHKTNIIRGMLCNACNGILGIYNDNIDILKNAINYLIASSNESMRENVRS
jgi:hypothetical protein